MHYTGPPHPSPTAVELAIRLRKRNTLKRGHPTGFRVFGVHALACPGLNSMAVHGTGRGRW